MTDSSKPSLRRVLFLYSAFQLFIGLLLWLPVFFEYQKRLGLSSEQIFSIQSIYYVAFCVVQIPSGLLADRWGRRRSLRLGAVAGVAANLLPVALPDYTGFLVSFLLIAVSRSLVAGASSAWLYDYLKASGAADDVYKRAEGRARAYSLVAKVLTLPAVGLLMRWHAPLIYWVSAASAGVAVAFAAMLPAVDAAAAPSGSPAPERRSLRDTGRLLLASPQLPLLMLQGVGLFVLARIVTVNLYNPILEARSIDVGAYAGLVMAVMTLFEAAGSYAPHLMRRWSSDLNAVFLLTAVLVASMGAMVFAGGAGTLVALCVFSLALGLSFPIQRQLMNDAIPDSRYRATLLSLEQIVDRAANAWVALILAGQLATGGLNRFLSLSAGVSLASVAVIMAALRWVARARPAAAGLRAP